MEALIVGGKVCMGKYGRKVFTIIGIQKPLEFIGGGYNPHHPIRTNL